ncbi:YadA-like family protein [Haemophilus haemolyticus]|uniref:YadA-like family protein n=1 Tax=Haemophilus haemolyticus TaxID=726 RepID=A0A852Q0R5_HAEHA|nr:YadA-like family protein [Haemophilus haemolyticus]NYA26909.1 YadA-like family protein [Haemophilus haemolyticus]
MNKIFRIVWSQATQSWVVVSELTKAHKKQSSSNTQKSAVKFSGNFIKSSAIALTLLSGHSAYAAVAAADGLIQINSKGAATASGSDAIAIGNDSKAIGNNNSLAIGHSAQATGNDGALAIGRESKAAGNNGIALGREAETTSNEAMALGHSAKAVAANAVAIGKDSKASGATSVALGAGSKATGNDSYAIGWGSDASANDSVAVGSNAKASGKQSVALGNNSKAQADYSYAIGWASEATKVKSIAIGYYAKASHNNSLALGWNSKALGPTSVALGAGSTAQGDDSYAIGMGSKAIGNLTMAFGNASIANKDYDIAIGKQAETRDIGKGYSIAIGAGAVSGTDKAGLSRNGNDAGGVAIGTGAYTGINKNTTAINSGVAVGAGAGAGYRKVDADGLPIDNATDADNNATVLVKAFGGTTSTLNDFKNAGKAHADGFFSFQNVDINEGTALGRNTRAIGDQSVAIGAQSIAGQGSIVIGGNDIRAYDKKKYFKAANPESAEAKSVNDYNAATTPGTGKNGQPITITKKYEELVGAALDNSWRSSYGQDGSTVIGMQAHSTTPLGVAIGTNSIVRKGAFGATAIGSGSSVLANAEAAVAIGMGAEAQGSYAVAAGTAAHAKEAAVAAGYRAKAEESAVAVGDHAEAVNSSVAVGQGAQSKNVSDIAIGQGAIASGKQGAIAMGLGTIAQGHSSIMIGGSDISEAAKQDVKYIKEVIDKNGTPKLRPGNITEVINGKTVTRTIQLVETEEVSGKKLSDAYREITGYNLNTASLDYSSSDNKNGHASISMGIHSLSKGAMGVAIGTGARADALGSMALGTGAHASMQNSVAIGTGAVADKVSKGTRQTDISYDEDGNVVETDSAKAKYTFRWAGGINTSEGDVVSFGTPGAERQLKNVAAGRVAEDSTDAVNGSQLNAISRSLSQTIANGWQVGGNNKFRLSNIGTNGRVNFLDGLGTAVNIAEINQAEDINGEKLVKIGSDFYKASDFADGKLKAGAQKVAAADIKKQPAGANVTFDVKEVNNTLSVSSAGLKVTTGEVTANPDGTMNTPKDTTTGLNTTTARNKEVTAAMNTAETNLVASQEEWRKKNDAYQRTELAYLEADTALTKGQEAVEAVKADIVTAEEALKTARGLLATDQSALERAQSDVNRYPNDTTKQSVLLKAKEKVESSQFVVDQRERTLEQLKVTLVDRQREKSKLEQAKTNAEAARNTAKGVYEVANKDLTDKKEAFETAKTAFTNAGANQIATVQNVADSINASGWTLQQGTTNKDLVQPGDKVAFVDGNGTTVTVTTNAEKKRSEIKFDIDKADLTTNAGKVVAPDLTELNKAVKDAQDAVKTAQDADNAGSTETTQNNLKEAKAKLAAAEQAQNKENNKVATAQSVAAAINDAYWIAAASGNGTNGTDDNVKAGTKVTFDAGKNIEIDHSTANKFTFKTVDNPVFTTVQIGSDKGPKITNDGDNLKVTKADGTSPTKITNVADGSDNNDAVNVSQLKASGWKVAGNNKTEVNTINPSEQVNFLDGSGTTVSVTKDTDTAGKETGNVNVKYDVNVGNGLQKDTTGNTISVKPADSTITVGANGVKVNTGDIATESTGKATTALDKAIVDATKELADATKAGDTAAQQKAQEKLAAANAAKTAAGKQIATVENVTEAINKAGWNAIAAKTANGEVSGEAVQLVKPGETVTFEADKNVKIAQNGSKFTFSTKDNVEFKSVKVGEEKDGKKPVSLTTSVATPADNNQTGKAPTTALNISSGTGKDAKPTQITGVGSVLNMVTNADQQPKLVNLGTAHGQTALDNNILNSAATVRDLANMGWKVSADKVTGADDKSYSDVVRNADEVKFVGKNAAKVSGKTVNGVRTITVDVEVPDVKTAKLVSSTDGSVIAPSTDSKLQDALKTAKDELVALPKDATDEQKKEAEKKVKDAETALNNAVDNRGVATAKNVADMINNSGFTLKTSATADGKKDDKSTGSEVIKSGKAVEMVAGKNLTVKQDADGKVTYSLNPELINLTSAEFKANGKPTTKISSDGITITPAAPTTGGEQKPNVSLTENGLNNGGNAITNVAGNLDGAKTGTDAPTTSATKPTALTETNAATVGDVLNAGWNIQEKGAPKDFVKAYDTVNFVQGDGTDVSVSVSANKQTSTVKYSVKADGNSLEVGAGGVKVKTSDGIETTTNGIAVKAADKTLTVGTGGVKVNTGEIAAANGGKVTVTPKTKADGTTETQAEAETRAASEIATVKNVADAINSAAWIAKVENTDDSVDTPTEDDKGKAVKAGDTLNLKAGKNLRVKRDGGNITFALAKDITVETANVENTLTIGKDGAKVNIASGASGLTLTGTETATDGSINNKAPVYLNGIKPTLTDTLAGSPTAHIVGDINASAYHRAASVQDVLNAGWNIRGAKQAGGEVENVDFVRTYDTVDFVSGNKATTDVTVAAEDGGKRAVVTITAKNDAGSITTAGGKVVVGTNGKADTDPKAGNKVAKTGDVANAINQSGWKTNATKINGAAATKADKTQLINPGDAVNYENGNGTVANVEVTQGKDGNPDTVSVKYDVKAADKSLEVGANGVKVKTSDGIETTANGIAVKAADKTLTVGKDGVKVNTGAIAAANGGDDQTANRGKVTVTPKTKADGTTETQAEAETRAASEIATVKNVADAINSAAWIAKVENTDDSVDTPTENDKGTAVKAGDTLNLKAGKNLKAKRDGQNITFALAKDITVETANVENTLSIGKDGAKVNIAPTANGLTFSRPAATAGGKEQPVTLSGISSGLDKFDAANPKTEGLLNLNKTETGKTEPTVGDNTAATVGDLRGMGWVLSAEKETGNHAKAYNAQVKNAEEVKFVGASGVTVSGKTEGNVRTITVGVDHQLATNNSVKPVEYTKKDGTKVYPKTVTKNDGTTETKFYPNADGTGEEVPAGDVIVSVNGAKGTTSPTTLSNVKSNLPETRNTADAGKPASKSQSAPIIGTADGNVNANNAATVGDVLNSGWNLKGNGSEVDFVRAYDTINFVNGKGTTVSIETDGAESRVKVDVDTGVITAETKDGKATGKVAGPVANAADLSKAIKDAQDELAKAGDEQAKKAAQTKLDTANKAADEAGLNKVATAQNVADMINNSGFTLKTSATVATDNLTADNTLKNDGEVINPGKTVEMVAGKNLTVKQDAGGKVTYATKDDVEFATVKIGEDKDGKKPVSLTTEKAVNASNNETGKEPATALKISSDGKPTQLVGVASVLNTSKVSTKPNGDKKADGKPAESKTEKLIDLADTASVNKNAAATVGDLQNMGWVVSTQDGNGYTDVVKNANKVDFKGGNGIEVTGKTTADGTREITVGIKEGTVTNNVKVTREDGTVIEAIRDKDGKLYEKDVNGKVDKTKPVETTNKDKVENNGSGFVTGNTVATAIQESGWNVGLADSSKANKAFNDNSKALSADKLEKVNPDDNVRFADGKNTKVQAATMDEVNKDGKKITNTYVRFNVDLPISQITSEDKDGNKVAKAADAKWYPVKEGKPDTTKEALEPSNVRTSASMDPDGLGDKYTSTTSRSREESLTPTQIGELTGKQEAAAKAAKEKIKDLLKGQSKDVIEAASKAAENAAKEEAKVQYLKDKGLDKGTGGTVISNVAWGTKPSDAVNVDQLQNSGINVHSRTVEGSTGKVISGNTSPTKVKMDETVNVDAGNNIEITRNGRDIAIATSMNPQFDSVQFGKEGPKITGKAAQPAKPATATSPATPAQPAELSVNSAKITNVAPGRISATSTDAVNGSQLHAVASSLGNLNNKINKVGKRADAGTASALAAATIPQAYTPGKSLVGIAAGNYQGQNGLAIGMSRISDNGKIIIRLSGTANTQGKTGIAAGVGYQW